MVSRRVDPMEPAVVAFGTIRGGQAENIIADAVTLAGSIRTFHPGTRAFLLAEVRRVAEAAARVHGCSVQVETRHGAPPVVNDPNLDTLVEKVAVELLGAGGVRRMPRPSSGSEDFSFFGRHAPAYMMRLGVRTQGGPDLRLHTSTFDLDEAAIGVGIRLMSRIVVEALCAKLPPAEI